MANQGLRKCIKQNEINVGAITAYVNTYSADANIILSLPILSTSGYAPINLSLIYNHQNRGEQDIFGKGIKLNYYKKLEVISNQKIKVTNADGSKEDYTLENNYYRNKETHLKIDKNYSYDEETGDTTYYYELSDEMGSSLTYEEPKLSYPMSIRSSSGEYIDLGLETSSLYVSNRDNNKVIFTKGSAGFVEKIEWKKNNQTKITANLYYSGGFLSSVIVKNSSNSENATIASYGLTIGETMIEVKDYTTGADTKFRLSSSKVYQIEEGFNNNFTDSLITKITYNGTRTIITNPHQIVNTIVYDKEGLTRLVKDDKENFIAYTYDMDTKALLAETPLPKPNQENNLFKGKTIADFTRYNAMSLTVNYKDIDPLYQSHTESKSCYLYGNGYAKYRLYGKFLPTDVVTIVIWAKQTMPCSVGSVSGYVQLTSGKNYLNNYFNKPAVDDEYFPFILGFTFTEAQSSIDISIHYSVYFGLEIGSVQIYKRDFGAFYQYDEKGNVLGVRTGGNDTNYSYQSGKLSNITSMISPSIKFKMDNLNRVTELVGAYQVKQEFDYDLKNRVTRNKIQNKDGSTVFETIDNYSSNDLITTHTDELGKIIKTTTDDYGNLINITKTLDSKNIELASDLNSRFDLNTLKLLSNQNYLLEAQYTYDSNHHNKIKTISLKNGMKYSFEYDNFDQLTNIKLNGVQLVSYTYDKFGQITHQSYGSETNTTEFTYTDYGQVETVKMGNKTYTYQYDALGNLTSISDNADITNYAYSDDGKLIEEKSCVNGSQKLCIKNKYDNTSHINHQEENFLGNIRHIDYERPYRSQACNAVNLANQLEKRTDFLSCLFINDDVTLKNATTVMKPFINGTEIGTSPTMVDEGVDCINLSSNSFKYQLGHGSTYGSFGFWYKFTYYNNTPTLLHIQNSNNSRYIALYINSEHNLAIQMRDNLGTVSCVHTTNFKAGSSGWQYLGIHWQVVNGSTKMLIMFNEEIEEFDVNKTVEIANPEYILFYNTDGKVGSVIAGNNQLLTVTHFRLFYKSTFDYIYNRKTYLNGYDFSCTSSYTNLVGYELFPLHHSLESTTGTRPFEFGMREVIVADSDRTFNYSSIGRYAYIADGAELAYQINSSGSLTIGLKMYIDDILQNNQYIFELFNDDDRLGLCIDSTGTLCISTLDSLVKTDLQVTTSKWHFIGFTYSKAQGSDSYGEQTLNIKIKLDDKEYSKVITIYGVFNDIFCSLGRKKYSISKTTQFGNYTESYPLEGLIEMFCYNQQYSSFTTLDALRENLKINGKVTAYNEFGLLSGSFIKEDEKEITTKTLTYQSKVGSSVNKSTNVASEKNYYSGLGDQLRSYEYDDLGRVKKITDSVFGSHSFEYSDKGFLAKSDTIDYRYDDNGNITTAGSTSFEYDPVIKDRLIKVNDKTIAYGSNPLNPTSYGDISYKYEGRRLISYETATKSISYSYNANGLRTKKTYNNITTEYYYTKNRLVGEKTPNYTLKYLYDENGLLYGFTKDNQTTYYYITDVYQNILGIMDNNGSIVVKYNYDAWGNHSVLDGNGNVNTSDTFIGNINPFRYKGYYYDTETQMYYCESRYYVPQWCRWLNGDSIGFLDSEDIHGMNLFAYCNNNPVMWIDPTGHFIISTLFWIIAGAAVLTTAGVITYGAVNEQPVVLDFSLSAGMGAGMGIKIGISLVLDFKNGSIGFYPHAGVFAGIKWNTIGLSYSVGVISNYENEGDYAGPFTDIGGGYLVGIDYCFDPTKEYDVSTRASSITFGNNKGGYYGNDYYWYCGSLHFPWRKR